MILDIHNNNTKNELIYILFQAEQFDPMFAIPMLIFWIQISAIVIILIEIKMLNRKARTVIYIITIIYGGVLLGGIPNAVMPIQQILTSIGIRVFSVSLLPIIIILTILLVSALFVGRIFCGFACPLGALQELISKYNFKSNLKSQKEAKYRLEVPSKIAKTMRWIFFGVLFLLAGVWSLFFLDVFNPLLGFSFFRTYFALTLIIPLIGLIVVSIASIFIYRPWCRFLCPFGAASSLCSRFSRLKYRRTENCTECGLCEKICPTQEAFADSKKAECYYCNRCVEICPNNAICFS